MGDPVEMDFDEWAKKVGLNTKTVEYLGKHDLCDLQALKVLSSGAADQLKLTIGQFALLSDALKNLQSVPNTASVTDNVTQASPDLTNPSNVPILQQLRSDPTIQESLGNVQDHHQSQPNYNPHNYSV